MSNYSNKSNYSDNYNNLIVIVIVIQFEKKVH